MFITMAKATGPTARATADGTLKVKNRDAVICGGHLVAMAPKAECVGTISALCGGHDTAWRV